MVQIVEEYRDYQSLIRGYPSKVVKTTYRELVKFVHRLVDEGRALQDIDLGFLEKYVIERTAGRSLGYRNILIGCLRSFFGYLCDQEVCPTNPARYLVYTKLDSYQRLPEVVSESRMRHCLRYLSEQATLPGIRREYTPNQETESGLSGAHIRYRHSFRRGCGLEAVRYPLGSAAPGDPCGKGP